MDENENKNKQRRTVRRFGIAAFVVFLIFGGYYGYNQWHSDYLNKQAMEAYEEELKNQPTPTPTATPTATPEATPEPEPPPEPTPEPIPTPSPTPEPNIIRQGFQALINETGNTDIVGMLTIPGTSINYPVVQSDDNVYYLERNIYKQQDVNAAIYLDYENDITRDDPNTVIYGHNMNADKMFHALRYWREKEFFDSHRYITFNTLYKDQKWEVFSFYKTNINFNYIQVFFGSDDDFYKLALEMQARSMYPTDIKLTKDDRILTLSTCSNQEEDTRYVLNARLIRE